MWVFRATLFILRSGLYQNQPTQHWASLPDEKNKEENCKTGGTCTVNVKFSLTEPFLCPLEWWIPLSYALGFLFFTVWFIEQHLADPKMTKLVQIQKFTTKICWGRIRKTKTHHIFPLFLFTRSQWSTLQNRTLLLSSTPVIKTLLTPLSVK